MAILTVSSSFTIYQHQAGNIKHSILTATLEGWLMWGNWSLEWLPKVSKLVQWQSQHRYTSNLYSKICVLNYVLYNLMLPTKPFVICLLLTFPHSYLSLGELPASTSAHTIPNVCNSSHLHSSSPNYSCSSFRPMGNMSSQKPSLMPQPDLTIALSPPLANLNSFIP